MPESTPDPARFRALIVEHLPGLRVDHMEPLSHVGWGGDSDVWLVNGDLVFRFPRSPDIAMQLAFEVRLLPELAHRLPLRIPQFNYVARDPVTGTPRFVGYSVIAGEPMTPAVLSAASATMDRDAAAIAASMGRFLSALHTFPLDRARALGAVDVSEPARTRALFDRVRAGVYPLLTPVQRAWSRNLFGDALANPALWDYTPALVHGDLSSDHILFDRATATIAGIIDFGDCAVGDPLGDFVGLTHYGASFLHSAIAAYARPLGRAADQRLAFHQRRLPFIALAWGAEQNDADALDAGMALLRDVLT